MEDYSGYTDEELPRAWNYLETQKLTPCVEKRMDEIMVECGIRGIVAWDKDGKIIDRSKY